jgi:hypothetical protein
MSRRSRLSLKTERKTRKTIILATLGILILLFFLIKFGTTLLVGFSVFLAGNGNSQTLTNNNSSSYLTPPQLNPLPNATNSAQIVIAGSADKNEKIILYINGNTADNTDTDNNGNYSFNEALSQGESQIKVKAQKNNLTSDYSSTYTVSLINSAPTLSVDSPSDGQSFSKDQNSVTVTGKTDANITVTVNGFWAIISGNNSYSYNLPLQNGDNQIKVIAIDSAGNKTEKDLKVTYSQ